MTRSKISRSAPIAVMMSALLLLLPMTSAMAQTDDRTEQLLDAVRYVEFDTRSAEPEAVHYLRGDLSASEMWSLEKRVPEKAAADAGSFRPVTSFSLAGTSSQATLAALQTKGVRQFDREIVVGTLYGPDGGEELVAALRFDFAVADGDRMVRESAMVPILRGTDLEKLQLIASELAERVTSRVMPADVGIKSFDFVPEKSTCRHYCIDEYQTDIFLCKALASACVVGITGVAVGCIFACPLTGPLVIPCLIVCGVVDVAGIAACLLNNWSCQRAAGRQRTSCIRDCPPPSV